MRNGNEAHHIFAYAWAFKFHDELEAKIGQHRSKAKNKFDLCSKKGVCILLLMYSSFIY
jgi:hypothetical protein